MLCRDRARGARCASRTLAAAAVVRARRHARPAGGAVLSLPLACIACAQRASLTPARGRTRRRARAVAAARSFALYLGLTLHDPLAWTTRSAPGDASSRRSGSSRDRAPAAAVAAPSRGSCATSLSSSCISCCSTRRARRSAAAWIAAGAAVVDPADVQRLVRLDRALRPARAGALLGSRRRSATHARADARDPLLVSARCSSAVQSSLAYVFP